MRASRIYSGVNMWRGVTRWQRHSGRRQHDARRLVHPGKLVIYPIRNAIDGEGTPARQLGGRDRRRPAPGARWSRRGRLADFHRRVRGLAFRLARRAGNDRRRRCRSRISDGRPGSAAALELRPGDAAWAMRRTRCIRAAPTAPARRSSTPARSPTVLPQRPTRSAALAAYEAQRREATPQVVRTNRTTPPDAILREVYLRTGDKPFATSTGDQPRRAGRDIQQLQAGRRLRPRNPGAQVVSGDGPRRSAGKATVETSRS